ncbi:MAG: hypothetical protein KGH87_02800 [Thaumarchaeota archaeon]|nr:hypothetical protein [Nitrososphaerota archaeon]MDE1838827.1 hypothetical protein [Nitrososphaerota archaeon]
MSNKIALLLLTVSVIMTSVVVASLPQANALIQRDFSIRDDTPTTASHGISKVCGDHLCAPGEHAQWINTLWQSQRAGMIGNTPSGGNVMHNMAANTMNGTK